jgi:hypothetical protein
VRVPFHQGTPAPLRPAFVEHTVETAFKLGWSTLQNGALIAAAEAEGFEVFLLTDKNLKYQQNLGGRSLAVVVLSTTSWRESVRPPRRYWKRWNRCARVASSKWS